MSEHPEQEFTGNRIQFQYTLRTGDVEHPSRGIAYQFEECTQEAVDVMIDAMGRAFKSDLMRQFELPPFDVKEKETQ